MGVHSEQRAHRLYALAPGRHVRIYDVRTGQQAFALKARGLVFSPDGSRIAAESDGKDGVLRVYDGRTGQDVFTIKGWSYPFSGGSSARTALALRRRARTAWCGHSTRGRVRRPSPLRRRPRSAPPFSARTARIAAFGSDQMTRVYDARTDQQTLGGVPHREYDRVARVYDARTDQQGGLSFKVLGYPVLSPDGRRVVVAGSDGKVYRKVYLYDLRTGQEVLAVEGSTGGAMPAVQVSPDGTRIAVGFEAFSLGLPSRGDGKVRLYDSRTGQEALALKGPARLCCPEFSPDGERVAVWCEDGTIRVYNARTAEEAFAFSGNLGKPAGLPAGRYIGKPAFSPDGARIAAEVFKDHGSEVQVRDARTGQEAFTLADAVGVTDPMFSPDSAASRSGSAAWCGCTTRGRVSRPSNLRHRARWAQQPSARTRHASPSWAAGTGQCGCMTRGRVRRCSPFHSRYPFSPTLQYTVRTERASRWAAIRCKAVCTAAALCRAGRCGCTTPGRAKKFWP